MGIYQIDDLFTFIRNTHNVATGAAVDADSVPTYRVYEDETTTPILTGSMALLDSANTVGYYSEQITLSTANGFEIDKSYNIYITATINAVEVTTNISFQIRTHIWDEPLIAATHNVSTSAGRRLRDIASDIVLTGTSPNTAGTANTAIRIEFDGDASAVDGAYDPAIVVITGGTGVGQARQVFEYDGTNKYAYINRSWKVVPDDTSEYTIVGNSGNTHVNEGLCGGSSNTSITLNTLADSNNDTYIGQTVFIYAGTGEDQARIITAYNGTSKIATIDRAWITNPANGLSVYAILPVNDNVSLNNISVADIIAGITDGGYDLQEMLRFILAAVAGQTTNGGLHFRDPADTKDRIIAVTDANKNRTSITLDGS